MKSVTESTWPIVQDKSVPNTILMNKSNFNKVHVINKHTYKPTNKQTREKETETEEGGGGGGCDRAIERSVDTQIDW